MNHSQPGIPTQRFLARSLAGQDSKLTLQYILNMIILPRISTTTTGGASTTLTFTGVAIQIFGTCGPDDAPYTVQLDDGTASTFNATKSSDYQQVLIYYADNLGPGTHEVTITNFPAIPNQSLNINYALVDKISR